MTTPIPDEQLMLQYGAGDMLAFQELYRRHRLGLYRFLSWRSPRAEWVDEVMQDAWANLHHARARYRPEAGFRTYLYQIARNRLLDLMRQHQPVLAAELGRDADGSDLFDALADAVHDSVSPQALVDARQQADSLHGAIACLPGEQKEALVLQQFSGMSIEEIAQVSGVPAETVKSRLRYAMRKLRQHLASAQGEEVT
jgi:RNA polymerase sigma-70 factor (ECF subfamily)